MDEPLTMFPRGLSHASAGAHGPRERARRGLLRRLLALLVVGGVAFGLTTWLLVRVDDPARLLGLRRGPASVVRAHLEALNRGELRAAYDLLSQRYRARVPFEAYHALVVMHWAMFRTREVKFRSREESQQRAVLETHLLAADGERYVARFTLVRAEGRWWIDDIRWGAEGRRRDLLFV